MIAMIVSGIYLLGLFFGLFIFIPWLLAKGTIQRWETEDAVTKVMLWPGYLAYLFFIAVVVLCVAVIYIPLDFLFEKSVKYFADRKKDRK
jgi:hypothetical protein